MRRDEDGEWQRLEPRPDLAVDDDAPRAPRRRPRPAPGKVTRTLALPPTSPAREARSDATDSSADAPPAALHADPFPDVFGGALGPAAATPAPPAAHGDGDLAEAKAAVDRAFATQRASIRAAAAEQGPALQQAAAAAHAQLLGDIGGRETTIRATFSQAREALRNAERTQIALARSDATAVARRLRSADKVRQPYLDAADVEADRVISTVRIDGSMITASANSMYTRLDTARGHALRNANIDDLRGTDGEVAQDALEAARASTRKQVQAWVTRDWRWLLDAGTRSSRALRKSATDFADHAAAPLEDAADEIASAGDMLASSISQGSQQSIESLAAAEREMVTSLARLRTRAATVLHAGQVVATRIRQQAATKVGELGRSQAAAHRALDTVAPAGGAAVAEMREYAIGAAADAGRDIIESVRAAPTALTAVLAERGQHLTEQIDRGIASLSAEVGPAATRFANECTRLRAQSVQDYSAGETQLTTHALSQLGAAVGVWRTEADRFIAGAGVMTADVLGRHREFERGLDAEFIAIARRSVSLNRRSDLERAGDTAAAGFRGLGQGVVNFAVGTAKYAAIVIAAPALPFGMLLSGAYLVHGMFKGAEARVDALRATWSDRSVVGKVAGVFETSAAIWGDQTGITSMVEGVLHHEAITHRTLSGEESGAKYSEGALNIVAAAVLKKFAGPNRQLSAGPDAPMQLPSGKRPAMQLPAGPPPPKQLPAGPPPPKQLAAGEAPAAAVAEPMPVARGERSSMRDAQAERGPRSSDARGSSPRGAAKEPSLAERHAELSKDPDHAGAVTEISQREATVALALEAQGRLKPPIRRPTPGDGHTGDFVDGDGVDWDVKGPMSRSTLIEKIRSTAAAKGRKPPPIDPAKPRKGEFTVDAMMEAIHREMKAGERVIVDAHGLTPDDLAVLRDAIKSKGLVLDQDVVIYE